MTGAAFLNLILKLADKKSTDTEYKSLALEWLNLVLKNIQTRQDSFHWRFLEKTATTPMVATQYNYALPSDIDTQKITSVYDRTNDRTYTYSPYELFVNRVADPTEMGGEPYIYTVWADEIWLYPTPSSTTTFYLDYIQVITALTDAASSCEVPAKYDDVIIAGVMEWVYKFDDELGNPVNQNAIYEAGIDRMRKENSQMIMENMRPVSHRWKHHRRGIGQEIFPLETTNY